MNSVKGILGAMAVVGMSALIGMSGCEKKEPAAAPAGDKSTSGAMKDAADSAGKSMSDAASSVKEAAQETAAKVEEKVAETAAAISEQAKTAMNDYLAGLGDANAVMEKIKSALDVPANLPALNDAAKKVNTNSTILGSLPDAEKAAVKDANSDQLGSLTAKFKEQMNRLMSGDLGKLVGDSLNSFKLFE
ncbi:MAG: hypothetical protein L6Q35_03050 [Phycisphaerales bacterium]|nr:hypothetical protein [Phycisphaerales bacterium]